MNRHKIQSFDNKHTISINSLYKARMKNISITKIYNNIHELYIYILNILFYMLIEKNILFVVLIGAYHEI
jgi:hypothetical protein